MATNTTWYAFHGYNNGQAIDASEFDASELNALGMHGYPTAAEADAKPNSVNVFQAPVVNAAIDDANNARNLGSLPGKAAGAAGKAAGKAAGGLIPNAFNLVFGNTTGLGGRVLKVIFGGVLIIAGVFRITGAGKGISAVATAASKGAA